MIIQFQKATPVEKEFSFETDGICISGTFKKINNRLVQILSNIDGNLTVNCARCSKAFDLSLNEQLDFRVSNGVYKEVDNVLEDDIVETYDETINFDEIFQGELESIKSDFNFCKDCQDNSENFEVEI
jgi:uncharacterized metal-binding protein YceD (DUF177 family)